MGDISERNGLNMKKMVFGVCIIVILFFSCASSPDTNKGTTDNIPKGPYFSGNGGKGIHISVLQPEYEGFTPAEDWMPIFIQGNLTANFNKYSAMTVLDRQNLDRILEEQAHSLSGYYSDDDFISIGKLTNAEYLLIGKLKKTSNSVISIQLSVTHIETGERKASYIKNCNLSEVTDLSMITDATIELLGQMGIELTEAGVQSIKATQSSTIISAETMLSKGIAAQRGGTTIEALSYYYESVSFNPSTEAVNRLDVLSSFVSNGNIVESVHNDFQQREAWMKILNECEDFYNRHLPYEILYNPTLSQGAANYEKRTVDLSFTLSVQPTAAFNVVQDILTGLKKTDKKETWGVPCWPLSSSTFADYYIRHSTDGKVEPYIFNLYDYLKGPDRYHEYYHAGHESELCKQMVIESELIDRSGKVLSVARYAVYNSITFPSTRKQSSIYDKDYDLYRIETLPFTGEIFFNDVNIDYLTDDVYVIISSINGIATETAMATGIVNVSATQKDLRHPKYRFRAD
jgi:hypothetical protein